MMRLKLKGTVSLAVLAVTLSCAAGLAVMSVDMGSEFMKIAIVKPGVPMEIALNKESRRKTPVIVSFKDGERLFSDPAANVAIRFPNNAYQYFLDLMGKKVSNQLVKNYKDRFPYCTIEADPDTGMVAFRHDDETIYTVEELMGMVLEKARDTASEYADQPITEAVITVPPYFNQAERRAMMRSAEMAGIKVLQLLNDNTAVALNYGVFRRKEFNGTAQHYMYFDMGASKTTATIVSYQVVKGKSPGGVEETFPQLTVRGIGFDRTLGGAVFQTRLRDHLAKLFTKVKKTSSVVTENPRAMAKLYKEAGRLKQVLSANVNHYAQIEGLLDDEDFRAKVSRDDFEGLCEDLFARIENVIKDAFKSSEVTREEISEVMLMGGGTRVPKVQQMIQAIIDRPELGKSINTDEAAALGGSFQAAHLSKGYRVKKFGIKDANIFPIQVEFERVKQKESDGDATEIDVSKMVKRTLFGRMNPFPQKKMMTFNKHVKDFHFQVNYGDLGFLDDSFIKTFGKDTLMEVALIGVEDAHTKHQGEAEAKGTKAHFKMDDSGLLLLDKVETLFEKMVEEEVDEDKKEESTLSKIGSTISSFFGGSEDKEEKEGAVEESKEENTDTAEETNKTESETSTEEKPTEQKVEEKPENDNDKGQPAQEAEEEAKKEEQDAKKKKVPTATLR